MQQKLLFVSTDDKSAIISVNIMQNWQQYYSWLKKSLFSMFMKYKSAS